MSLVQFLCSVWFPLLTLSAWNLYPECESCAALLLGSIVDIANLYPGSESCVAPLLDSYCWHCLHEIPPRKQVLCSSFAWFLLLTLPAWNPIQKASCVQLLCLISTADISCMILYPESESYAAPLLDLHCWHCLHEIPSRLWVLCSFFAWFPLLTLLAWNPIQAVSPV